MPITSRNRLAILSASMLVVYSLTGCTALKRMDEKANRINAQRNDAYQRTLPDSFLNYKEGCQRVGGKLVRAGFHTGSRSSGIIFGCEKDGKLVSLPVKGD